MSDSNPYAVNGYANSNSNVTNPYGASSGGANRYNDPYLQQQNQSSASVNSYNSRDADRRRRSNPYAQEGSPGPPAQNAGRRGGGGGGYGGLSGLPSQPGPQRPQLQQQSSGDYDPYGGSYDRRPSVPPEDRRQRSVDSGDRRPPTRSDDRRYGDNSRSRERGDRLRPGVEERPQQQQPQPPIPSTQAAVNGYGAATTSTTRYKDYSSRRGAKSMDEIMKHIQGNWKTMEGDECVPIKVALQLMDPSSLGLADKEADFAATHVDLQKCLKGVVNEHYADFNSAVGTYHKIQNAIRESQNRVRVLKSGLMNVKGGMLTTRPELRGLAETSASLDDTVGMLSVIEDLKNVPTKLEERISEKRFLGAVDLLMESLRGLRKSELEEIAALSDMRGYFANQESSLVDILVEELHDHLYLKSPYCHDRWNTKAGNEEAKENPSGLMNGANAWDRPVYHFLSNLDTTKAMEEDASKNPESNTFYYIHMILEALNKLGHLEEAIQRIEQRMPLELYRVVGKTNNEIDAKYPSHVRGQLNKDKRVAMSVRINDGRNQVLSDFLWTLYSKFEAIAEGHRVLHEVVAGIVAREGISKAEKYTGGFKELWKLYQMEMRSILHDYLATDADHGARTGIATAANADIFARQQRDKNKKMFKLSEMDEKASGIKAEEDELDEILKSSVPGLVSKSKGAGGANGTERGGHDNTSAGHKLLIEPGVFNMTVLLPPSLAFLQHLKDVVPQTSHIPMSTLTSFLDDFLINIFHPQLEEAVTELCAQSMIDMEAFFEDPLWSKHSPHPIFKGTAAFMALIRSFSDMLSSIPQDQMFTQLIITQLVRYYDKCFGFYKSIVSRVVQSPTNPNANVLTLKAAASHAETGDIHTAAIDLLKTTYYQPNLVLKEVSAILSAAKASPIQSFDIISDPKSVHQLSLLYNSMQWLSAALTQLRHVDTTVSKSHSRSASQPQSVRRWTLIQTLKPTSPSANTNIVYLPLTPETAVPFDHTLSSFRTLATTSLIALHLDIRFGILHQLSRVLRPPEISTSPDGSNAQALSPAQRVDSSALPPLSSGIYPFVLTKPPSSASPLILQLNADLISFDANISSYLGIKERRFIVSGLSKLVDKFMVVGADNVLVMNANGAERMRVDGVVVQQNLRGLSAGVASTSTVLPPNLAEQDGLGIATKVEESADDDGLLKLSHQYYTLFLHGADDVMKHVKEKKSKGEDVVYSYDELRTLIELCFSEKLRGDDREESVKARKRCGEVLLELGEGMWDS